MQLRRPNVQDERENVDVWIGLSAEEARYLHDGNGGNLFPRLAALNALTEQLADWFGWEV